MNKNKTQAEQLPQDAVMQSVLKENDLRIGNFIKVISSNKTFDSYITQAKGYDIVRIEEKSFTYWNYEPVILTEEWLLKFGFKVDYGCIILSTNRGVITIEEDLAEISSVITHNGVMAPCRYVHQLQNLYFALTGSELTVA